MTTAQLVGPYERLMLLKALSQSAHPPAAALGALAQQAAEVHLDGGARIPDEDETWKEAYVVVEGLVHVFRRGERLYSAAPGEWFGLLETLAHKQGDDIVARAEVDTLTLQIRAPTLLSILEDHQAMTLEVIHGLGRRLLAQPVWLASVMERSIRSRRFTPGQRLDLIDRIERLRSTTVFAHARVDSVAEIAAQYEEFQAGEGSVLWREGDQADWFLVLLGGSIDVASRAGLRARWPAGTAPGVFDALSGGDRWHDAVASGTVTGFRVSAERVFDVLEDDFAMAEDLLSGLATLLLAQHEALRQGQLP